MANSLVYTSAGIAFILIALLSLIVWIQNSINESRLLPTPTIPKENAVLTSFASARINAPVDEVFAVLLNYKDYLKWSCFSQYKWQEVTEDGAPRVGSTGSFKVRSLLFLNLVLYLSFRLSQCWRVLVNGIKWSRSKQCKMFIECCKATLRYIKMKSEFGSTTSLENWKHL